MKSNFINVTHIEGYLYDTDLSIRTTGENSKNPGTEYISGNVRVATDEDYENMFEEGYSGYWAKAQALDGSGIGMYYIKRLMNLNKGEFTIERGKNNFLVDGIPYSTNIFTFLFKKDKGD